MMVTVGRGYIALVWGRSEMQALYGLTRVMNTKFGRCRRDLA